jgi:hypothetical protein
MRRILKDGCEGILEGIMPKRIASLIVAAAGGLIAGIAVMAAASPKLSSQDYNEIHALYARYAHTFDKTDPDAYGNVFTADGQFVIGVTLVSFVPSRWHL